MLNKWPQNMRDAKPNIYFVVSLSHLTLEPISYTPGGPGFCI